MKINKKKSTMIPSSYDANLEYSKALLTAGFVLLNDYGFLKNRTETGYPTQRSLWFAFGAGVGTLCGSAVIQQNYDKFKPDVYKVLNDILFAETGVVATICIRFLLKHGRLYSSGFSFNPAEGETIQNRLLSFGSARKHVGSSMGHVSGYVITAMSCLSAYGILKNFEEMPSIVEF